MEKVTKFISVIDDEWVIENSHTQIGADTIEEVADCVSSIDDKCLSETISRAKQKLEGFLENNSCPEDFVQAKIYSIDFDEKRKPVVDSIKLVLTLDINVEDCAEISLEEVR